MLVTGRGWRWMALSQMGRALGCLTGQRPLPKGRLRTRPCTGHKRQLTGHLRTRLRTRHKHQQTTRLRTRQERQQRALCLRATGTVAAVASRVRTGSWTTRPPPCSLTQHLPWDHSTTSRTGTAQSAARDQTRRLGKWDRGPWDEKAQVSMRGWGVRE